MTLWINEDKKEKKTGGVQSFIAFGNFHILPNAQNSSDVFHVHPPSLSLTGNKDQYPPPQSLYPPSVLELILFRNSVLLFFY